MGKLLDILYCFRTFVTENNHCFNKLTVSKEDSSRSRFPEECHLSENYEIMKMLTFSLSTVVRT